MTKECEYEPGRNSLARLIGWLSLCLLAAGWGPQLDETVRQVWASAGLFGLASAVALEVVQRTRLAQGRRKQERITQRRIERELRRLAADNATIKRISAALGRIAEDEQWDQELPIERRCDTRLPFRRPVEVKPLEDNLAMSPENDDVTFTAYIRNISAGGLGLIHDEPIRPGRVMIIFRLRSGEEISIMAELLWGHPQADGKYSSGGKLVEVITPVKAPVPVPVGTRA